MSRFGPSVVDTGVRLQGLRCDPCTPLQEHAAMVKRLAQIAHSKFSPANRERYTYDAFVQSLGDLGLHHKFLATGVKTAEDALRESEAYLQANQLHKNHTSSHQVETELQDITPKSEPTTHVAATARPSLATEVAHMTEVVGKLMAALAQSQMAGFAQRPKRSRSGPAARWATACWKCGCCGHLRRNCLQSMWRELNCHGLLLHLPAAGRK